MHVAGKMVLFSTREKSRLISAASLKLENNAKQPVYVVHGVNGLT